MYEASTKLLVYDFSRTEDGTTQLDLSTLNSTILLTNTYKEIFSSPVIMNKVVEQYPDMGWSVGWLMQSVKMTTMDDSPIMTISMRSTSYEEAATIVNVVSKVFKEQINGIMNVDNVDILYDVIPEYDAKPDSSNLVTSLVVSFVIAMIAGLTTVILLDYFDDSMQNETDVQEVMGLQTLCVVHAFDKKERIESKTLVSKKRRLKHRYASMESDI